MPERLPNKPPCLVDEATLVGWASILISCLLAEWDNSSGPQDLAHFTPDFPVRLTHQGTLSIAGPQPLIYCRHNFSTASPRLPNHSRCIATQIFTANSPPGQLNAPLALLPSGALLAHTRWQETRGALAAAMLESSGGIGSAVGPAVSHSSAVFG